MTRREFVDQIAFAYAKFEHEYAGKRIQPLNREFAFHQGDQLVRIGRYAPRRTGPNGTYGLDYNRVAYEARRRLPYMRRLIREAETGLI